MDTSNNRTHLLVSATLMLKLTLNNISNSNTRDMNTLKEYHSLGVSGNDKVTKELNYCYTTCEIYTNWSFRTAHSMTVRLRWVIVILPVWLPSSRGQIHVYHCWPQEPEMWYPHDNRDTEKLNIKKQICKNKGKPDIYTNCSKKIAMYNSFF